MMVGVPPIYGIYTGIVGPLVYTFLGTSHQASTGRILFRILLMIVAFLSLIPS